MQSLKKACTYLHHEPAEGLHRMVKPIRSQGFSSGKMSLGGGGGCWLAKVWVIVWVASSPSMLLQPFHFKDGESQS